MAVLFAQCVAFGLLYTAYYLVYCFTAYFISFEAHLLFNFGHITTTVISHA